MKLIIEDKGKKYEFKIENGFTQIDVFQNDWVPLSIKNNWNNTDNKECFLVSRKTSYFVEK